MRNQRRPVRLSSTARRHQHFHRVLRIELLEDRRVLAPAMIDTYEKLQQIGSGQNGYSCTADYVLTQDVVFPSGERLSSLCRGNEFSGTFDGGGHKIVNLQINEPTLAQVGLFSKTSQTAVIKNLTFEEPWIIGFDGVGTVAGSWRGLMFDVHVLGGVVTYENESGDVFGGVVGDNHGTIRNSSFEATASYNGWVEARGEGLGGIAGWNYDTGVIEWCYVRGTRLYGLRSDDGAQGVGGIVGFNYGVVRESYYEASFAGTTEYINGRSYVGGIVGSNGTGSVVQNSYSIGQVDAYYDSVGGIGGEAAGTIQRTFAIGPVRSSGGRLVGGLGGSLEASFWDSSLSGPAGAIGYGTGSVENCVGRPTSQMRQQQTFVDAGWDFENVWTIAEGNSYPTLRGARPSLTANPTGISASDGVPGKVTVSWNPVADAGAYGVYRTEDPSFPLVLLGFTSESPFIDRTAGPGTQYLYYVTAAITIYGAGDGDVTKANSDVGHMTVADVSWQNPDNPFDVDANGSVNASDVLLVVIGINYRVSPLLPLRTADHQHLPYYDVNGDGYLTPLDVLIVIAHINLASSSTTVPGEGESATGWPLSGQTLASPVTIMIADRPETLGSSTPDVRNSVDSTAILLVQPGSDMLDLWDLEPELPDWETLLDDDRPMDLADLDAYFAAFD